MSRVTFDPTINLGHIITGAGSLVAIVGGWIQLDARITATEREGKRIEVQAERAVAKVETSLLERIKTNETVASKFEFNYREDMRDVKILLTRIEDKLDKKADKPR